MRTMPSREEEDEVKVWGIGNTLILIKMLFEEVFLALLGALVNYGG